MSSPIDDRVLDDAELWALIDSAAAASLSPAVTSALKPRAKPLTPIPFPLNSPPPKSPNQLPSHRHNLNHSPGSEVVQNHRPHKIPRTVNTQHVHESALPQLMMVKRTPTETFAEKLELGNSSVTNRQGQIGSASYEKMETRHCLSGQFPTVSLFKDYQNAAMAILEKNDYTMLSGNPYIKKSGWRKISFYFNVSYEIKDKTIEFDENRNVQRAEFIARAHMQGGRFSDGWGSCERREKRFSKPNHDIPSTAETRAKTRACQVTCSELESIGQKGPKSFESLCCRRLLIRIIIKIRFAWALLAYEMSTLEDKLNFFPHLNVGKVRTVPLEP
ncbi:hypothetical protein CASFOL_027674 [Castilleja foliolosa]|uniref:Uncharacterized protein n=1 Tax=Castilleja foliolosa TaxID=1961234 RepID=A0ABD3CFH4_9LAMI